MKKTAVCIVLVCGIVSSCVSIPPPSAEEAAVLQRARSDLADGYYEWVLHDMETYLRDHPRGGLSAEAHILAGDAAMGHVDAARTEKKMTGMILSDYTAPFMRKAYENYVAAADKAAKDETASEALYKAAVILDIKYMKRFEQALIVYGKIISEYPKTSWAQKAQARYDNLDDKFRKLKAGPHSSMGEEN